jgi:dCMP deaminase
MSCGLCGHSHEGALYCPTCMCNGQVSITPSGLEQEITEEELRKIYAVAQNFRMEVLPPTTPTRNVVMVDIMNDTNRIDNQGRPIWDQIWMDFAEHIAQRSTCDRASVGCVVVSSDNSAILGLGYNGSAKGLPNGCLSSEPGKCGHIHAEINALIKTNYRDASFKKAYITTSPCYNCSIALINAGIQEVIFKTAYRDQTGPALLSQAGVKVRKFPEEGVSARDPYINADR